MAEEFKVERDEHGRFKKVTKAEKLHKTVEVVGGTNARKVTIMSKGRTQEK